MDLTARAAVLTALGQPRSGQEIARLLASRSQGQVRLHYGSLYPTLRRLETDRLVRSWIERVGRGRPRRNYELTIAGVAEAQRVRENLRTLISPTSSVSRSRTPRQMAAGIRGCEAISQLARGFREAGGRE
jgi:DNA-binding PadR family transcriptional regulator